MRTPRLRLLSALLSVAMLFTFLPTAAFAASTTFTVDKIQYTVTDEDAKTVSVTKYKVQIQMLLSLTRFRGILSPQSEKMLLKALL